jgi:cobalt/nickel transport system permease protein
LHIPDGYISPQTAGGLWAMMVPAWYAAGYKVKRTLSARQAPLVAIGAAFAFVIMMFNLPLPGGTTGHAVGGTIIAIAIGPWAAVIAITVALVIQALFFGDGGILALGANCFNMAFVLPVSGYFTYRLLSRGASRKSPRRWLAAGIGAYVGLNLAALLTAVEFGLQGDLFTAADGSALYSPYGLSVSVPAMMGPHLLVVGLLEAVITSLIYIYLQRTDSVLLDNYDQARAATASKFELKPLIIGLALTLICLPLGLLATGTAWGEWGSEDVAQEIGYVPPGMEKYSGLWRGIMPDYAFSDGDTSAGAAMDGAAIAAVEPPVTTGDEPVAAVSTDGVWQSTPAYIVSGIIGLAFVGAGGWAAGRLITRRNHKGRRLG